MTRNPAIRFALLIVRIALLASALLSIGSEARLGDKREGVSRSKCVSGTLCITASTTARDASTTTSRRRLVVCGDAKEDLDWLRGDGAKFMKARLPSRR